MMTNHATHKRGLTLIEVLVYLALYSILMTGALVGAYTLIESSGRNQAKAMAQEEGNFLSAKLDWVLTGARSISNPAAGSSGTTLSVVKWDTSFGNPIVVEVIGGNMTISRGGAPAVVLNNSNVQITCKPAGCFSHTAAVGDGVKPESASTTFTIETRTQSGSPYSQEFSTLKYLRK